MYFSHHPCNKLSTYLPYPHFTPLLTQPNHPHQEVCSNSRQTTKTIMQNGTDPSLGSPSHTAQRSEDSNGNNPRNGCSCRSTAASLPQ